MSEFIQQPKRSVALPLGCKDLIEIEEIRNWKPHTRRDYVKRTMDRLAFIEGYLAQVLQPAEKSPLVGVSRRLDKGQVTVIQNALENPAVFASWNGAAQEQVVRAVFEEAGLSPIIGPVGHWKAERSLKYPLPTDASVAARLIGEVFRAGYGLGDLSSITLFVEPCVTMSHAEIDEAILAVAEESWKKVAMIIARTAERISPRLPEGFDGSVLIARRIKHLVIDGRLVAQGNVGKWRNAEVRLP